MGSAHDTQVPVYRHEQLNIIQFSLTDHIGYVGVKIMEHSYCSCYLRGYKFMLLHANFKVFEEDFGHIPTQMGTQ